MPNATNVAKQRIVNTKFWDDSYIARLTPTEKLLFLYLITNPLTNIAGVYELPVKRVAFDIGIPAEKHKAIFEAFTQVENSETRAYGGSGLGLTIARDLVVLMGGRLDV